MAAPRPLLIFPRASHSLSQPGAFGLSSDRVAATVSSRRRRDFVFLVNPSVGLPASANGRTGKQWKQLLPHLRIRLADQCKICECITSGPSHAIDVTREAIKDGADAVIAVGGDGTLREMVNGFFWKTNAVGALDRGPDHSMALGLIPLGTGSDFARTFGWSAKAGYFASMYKRFGNLCYVFGTLRSFWGHNNRDLRIKVNGGEWRTIHEVTALCIGNAKYFGGNMRITPAADPFSRDIEVPWTVKFGLNFEVQSIKVVEVVTNGDIFVQSDGGHFALLPTKFSVLPGVVDFFC